MGGRWGWSQDGGVRADEALVETAASTFHPLCLDNREFRDDWGMRGSRRTHMPGVGDEFVDERLITNVDGPEPPMQCLACKNVVEHLATAVMRDAPPPVRRKGSIEHDKRAFGQQRITGVLTAARAPGRRDH